MNKVLLALGSVFGILLVTRRKPESKFARSVERIKDFGFDTASKVADTSIDVLDEGFDTAKDVFQILDNDEVPDADAAGVEGADTTIQVGDEEEEPEFAGRGMKKSRVLAPNDEADQMLDLGFTKQFSRGSRGFDPNMTDIMDDFKNDN